MAEDSDPPDAEPVDLTPPQWHRDVVEVAQELLDRAKRGDITDLALTYVRRSGAVGTTFAGRGKRNDLIAGAHLLLSRLVSE